MIIKDIIKKVEFSNVSLGGTFRFDGKICMATEYVRDEEGEVNSVDLSNGDLLYIRGNEKVEEINGYFQVK